MIRRFINRLKKFRRENAVILMYHQVCDRKDDPWELAVHPNHFEAQLAHLQQHFDVVPMAELAEGISRRKMKKTIALTFDDGFRDNYTNAAPLLDYFEMPATFYVATIPAQEQATYWWDALQAIVFHTATLPRVLDLMIDGERLKFTFASDHVLSGAVRNQLKAWHYHLPVPNERVSLYMLLWSRIKSLPYSEQKHVLTRIREWAGYGSASGEGDVMTIREIQTLSRHPLFSIGAHSVHHAMLTEQTPGQQAFEVTESKRQLEAWVGKPVTGFAYPYGSYNEVTREILKRAGFQYAVSTECKPVTVEDDPFALPRVQVRNWCVYEFAAKINELIHE